MRSQELKQMIRESIQKHSGEELNESIQDYIKEIDTAGDKAAVEAKMAKCEEAIALREKKINMDGLDEAYHDMVDKTKMGELKKEIKHLEKSLTKYKKQLSKFDGSAASPGDKSEEPKKKVVTEEEPVVEADIDLEEDTIEEDLTQDELGGTPGEETQPGELNESFKRMKKLAGIKVIKG